MSALTRQPKLTKAQQEILDILANKNAHIAVGWINRDIWLVISGDYVKRISYKTYDAIHSCLEKLPYSEWPDDRYTVKK